jgi:anthranilate synthase/aminodeoxychorismate synthase-like glutamine amidotransferase
VILLIDNYDSFTFNLADLCGRLGARVEVVRNDAEDVAQLLGRRPSGLLLSPGPGRPESSGVCPDLLCAAPANLPVLGICLGHQALVESEGGRLNLLERPVHGRATRVHHDGQGLFQGLPSPLDAGRYHSLVADREEGLPMAVQHRDLPRFGLQFHPESILTPLGERLIARFLGCAGEPVDVRRAS